MKFLILSIAITGFFIFVPNVHAATFFIDADCATPGTGGVAECDGGADDAFDDFLDFTEATNSAGDIAIARRGTTVTYDDSTDLNFTSDGTRVNPITLEADFGDAWGDFASSTETATLTFGSSTITMSASSTEIQVGKWIWAIGDDNKEFSYEVKSVSSAVVTLFLPYKGAQAGAGVSIEVMPAAPIHGTLADTTLEVNISGDDYWLMQGLHFRSTDSSGVIDAVSGSFWIWKDVIVEANGANDTCYDVTEHSILQKNRIFNCAFGIELLTTPLNIFDSLIDGNNASNGLGIIIDDNDSSMSDTEIINWATAIFSLGGNEDLFKIRNFVKDGSTLNSAPAANGLAKISIEDFDNTLGDTRQLQNFGTTSLNTFIQSDTGTTRSGGSNFSIKVTPTIELSTNWDFGRIKILEIPFFATTTSKKYEVFMRPTATADWTADPTAAELWCELEAWGDADNNFRQITKSTETIDMNNSTTFTSLSVTVAPAQAGVAYLRCYYAKTKESAKANTFFVDPIPVVT